MKSRASSSPEHLEKHSKKDSNGTKPPSFARTLSHFSSETFHRRKGTVGVIVPKLPPLANEKPPLPTPSSRPGLTRSQSFFGSLSSFSSNTPTTSSGIIRNFSTKFAERPFFQARNATIPAVSSTVDSQVTPPKPKVQIESCSLMVPLGPPLPRSKTFNALSSSEPLPAPPGLPRFARPTSSSRARSIQIKQNETDSDGRTSTAIPGARRNGQGYLNQKDDHTSIPLARRSTLQFPSQATNRATDSAFGRSRQQYSHQNVNKTISSSFDTISKGLDEQGDNMNDIRVPPTVSRRQTSSLPIRTPISPESIGTAQCVPLVRPSMKRLNSSSFPVDEIPEPAESRAENTTPMLMSAKTSDIYDTEESFAEEEKDTISMASNPVNIREVSTPQPSAYWLGRLTSLSDRFRTQELSNPLPSSPHSHRPHNMHDEALRTRRAFIHLANSCTTDDARASLAAFKTAYEARVDLEVRAERGERVVLGGRKREDEAGVKEKLGVFERLVNRKRRSEAKK